MLEGGGLGDQGVGGGVVWGGSGFMGESGLGLRGLGCLVWSLGCLGHPKPRIPEVVEGLHTDGHGSASKRVIQRFRPGGNPGANVWFL